MGIVTVLGVASLVSFVNSRRVQNLATAGNEVLAVLRTAQERALAGEQEDMWGVHLETGQYHLFRGASYASGTTVGTYTLPSGIEIANIALAGGGAEAAFRRLDGATTAAGTFTVRVQGSATQVFDITIDASGRSYQTGTALPPAGGRTTDTRHRTFALSWGIDDATDVRFSFSDPTDVRTVAMTPAAPRATYDSGELAFTVGGFEQVLRVHALAIAANSTTLSIDRDCRYNTKRVVIAIRDADAVWRDIATYEANCITVTVGPYGGTISEP